MTETWLAELLETAQAKADGKGEHTLPEGRTLTLHVAHAGATLSVSKVETLRIKGDVVRARNARGELYLLRRDDVFAAMIDAPSDTSASRKAGFLG
jgi:hypothetical protein